MSKTVKITSAGHFGEVTRSSTVVVVDFYADWCGPCKTIAPLYEQLANRLSVPNKVTFTKVNTDEQKEVAQTYNISTIPTFVILRNGRETDRMGPDPKKLQAAVQKLAQEAESAASSSGPSGPQWTAAEGPRGYEDVTDQVDVKMLDLLNADGEKGGVRSLFESNKPSALEDTGKSSHKPKPDWVESDTDEQLMLFMPFQATLKVHTLHITSLPPSEEAGSDDEIPMRPKTIHAYVNQAHNLGFEEAEGLTPTQTITLSESDWDKNTGTAKVELKYVRFQKCSSIVLFVVDGDGDGDKVRLDRIRLFGDTGEKKNMGQLQKIGDEPGE